MRTGGIAGSVEAAEAVELLLSEDEELLFEPHPPKKVRVASSAMELTKNLSMRVSFPKSGYQKIYQRGTVQAIAELIPPKAKLFLRKAENFLEIFFWTWAMPAHSGSIWSRL
jgi:hypothetical protein